MNKRAKINQIIDELLKDAGFTKPGKARTDYKWRMPGHQQILKSQVARRKREETRELVKQQQTGSFNQINQARVMFHNLVKEKCEEHGLSQYQTQQVITETENLFMDFAIDKIFAVRRRRLNQMEASH